MWKFTMSAEGIALLISLSVEQSGGCLHFEDGPLVDGLAGGLELRRSHVRFTAAMLPQSTEQELVQVLARACNIRPQDARFLLQGRSLTNGQLLAMQETPVAALQAVGRMLSSGATIREVVQAVRVSEATVSRVNEVCNLTGAYAAGQRVRAADAIREGLSVRQWAARERMPVSTAGRIMMEVRP
jgi:hypothetical protein